MQVLGFNQSQALGECATGLGRYGEHKDRQRGSHLVSEDGQPFLERKLEPVPAGHPVPRPVMEVLVANHALDPRIVQVSGCSTDTAPESPNKRQSSGCLSISVHLAA